MRLLYKYKLQGIYEMSIIFIFSKKQFIKMASNIEKILDVLDDNETDINKIANISHHFLLVSSMKNAR